MRRAAAVLVVPLLVLGGLVAGAPTAEAQHPGANGAITFVDQAVWSGTARADGTPRRCCTPDGGPESIAAQHAVWGIDGRTVAVVGVWSRPGGPDAPEILVYDVVDDTVRSLGPADDSRPDFSPDGAQVVITRAGDLVVLDAATGTLVRNVTSTPAVIETDPSWSPDGDLIAFSTAAGISVVSATGGAAVPLVAGASSPQYSGDGRHLAYVLDGQLWTANADGTGGVCTGVPVYAYTWSPDSSRFVALVDLLMLGEEWQSSDVWIVSPSGQPLSPGPGMASSSSFSWQPVPAPEPVVVVPLASVSGSTSSFSRSVLLRVRWSASDLVSTVVGTDVRYRRASALGGAYSTYRWWQNDTAARSATLPATPGYRYCFSTRARNQAGAQSGWSVEKCATVPLDDRALRANGSWVRVSRDGFLRGTASRTTQKGASLTSAPGYVREVGIVASTGPNGGAVAVFVGSHRIGTISLASAARTDRALLTLPRLHTGRYGAVRLVVVSSGKTVRIDGLATSAR